MEDLDARVGASDVAFSRTLPEEVLLRTLLTLPRLLTMLHLRDMADSMASCSAVIGGIQTSGLVMGPIEVRFEGDGMGTGRLLEE